MPGRGVLMRRGFTLIELLVVIAIVALLMSLLIPSLGKARDLAKQSACASNLGQLSKASLAYSLDHRGFYCSGPFDNSIQEGYGPIETRGWVADMLVGGYANPGKLLCPGSPARFSETLNQSRINSSRAYRPDGQGPYTQADLKRLIDEGYNTNYAQNWQMAHTDTRTEAPPPNVKDVRYLLGPLQDRYLVAAGSPSLVALFADGTIQNDDRADRVTIDGLESWGAKTLTDGPYIGIRNGRPSVGRQRFDDWGPVHGRGPKINNEDAEISHDRLNANIGFADGHVALFSDNVIRDGMFNASEQVQQGSFFYRKYDELEGRVYGGWLARTGLNW